MNRQQTLTLKGIAIVAVVILHVLTLFPKNWFYGKWSVLWLGLDQFFRFAVPLFIFLSGYGVAKKYWRDTPRQPKAAAPLPTSLKLRSALLGGSLLEYFYKRTRVLIPMYLLWSLFYWLNWHIFDWWNHYPIGEEWWHILLMGQAEYHLYFIPLILILYLLFPVFNTCSTRLIQYLTVIAFVIQIIFYGVGLQQGWSDQLQNWLVFSWMGYFLMGILVSRSDYVKVITSWIPDKARNTCLYWNDKDVSHKCIFILVFLALSFLVWHSDFLLKSHDPNVATRQTNLFVIPYSISMIMLLVSQSDSSRRTHSKLLDRLGSLSLIIYFAHTFLLRLYYAPVIDLTLLHSVILYVLLLVISWLISRN